MWRRYVKADETADMITCHYSTETMDQDGENVYNKRLDEWEVTRLYARDDCAWCIGKTEEKFRHVGEEGFPGRRMVAIG